MPELPEVETTRRGIEPWVLGRQINSVLVRERRLRWPVPGDLAGVLHGKHVLGTDRRAKYLFLLFDTGRMMIHLGMSGSLRVIPPDREEALKKHDHIEWHLDGGYRLRLHDPRRFGSVHWLPKDAPEPDSLQALGPEPLSETLTGEYLYALAQGKRSSVKAFIMDQRVVVGVGNIYANEALHMAGIHPARAAGRISQRRYQRLADCIKCVLGNAIEQGGTTLRDFVHGNGEPGYFQQSLLVYDRAGRPCRQCGDPIHQRRLGQRSSYFCPRCQR
jgi:formamidopyrimidine-DNA glycosylase